MTESTSWYGCMVCGEMRKFPFEAHADDSGCRCPTADEVRAAELRASDAVGTDRSELGASRTTELTSAR